MGAGLGLYLVKTILSLHGGQITVSSVEGQYTEFSFVLTAHRKKTEEHLDGKERREKDHKERREHKEKNDELQRDASDPS